MQSETVAEEPAEESTARKLAGEEDPLESLRREFSSLSLFAQEYFSLNRELFEATIAGVAMRAATLAVLAVIGLAVVFATVLLLAYGVTVGLASVLAIPAWQVALTISAGILAITGISLLVIPRQQKRRRVTIAKARHELRMNRIRRETAQ